VHPRDDTENRVLIARAERLFQERLGDARLNIGHALTIFAGALERQTPDEISKARRMLSDLLDELDHSFFL
jgi:molecular chaperone HscC